MNEQAQGLRETTSRIDPHGASSEPTGEVLGAGSPRPEVTYTLKVLSSSASDGDGELRTVLFRRVSDGEAIEISAETCAQNLLEALPEFLEAALEIQRALWPAQRTVSELPVSFFPLLTEESRLLRRLTQRRGGATLRGLERRRVLREATIVRDIAWEALRNALGSARRAEIDALAREPSVTLAESMIRVAAYIERMLRHPTDWAILVACDLDAAYAASLRRHATLIRNMEEAADAAPEDEPRQTGLLRLIGAAYRAIRTEAFMTVPKLDRLPTLSERREARSSRPPRTTTDAGGEPAFQG